jgi:hypothetical protein
MQEQAQQQLTPTEELINIAKTKYNLSYGLDFDIPEDTEHSVSVIGGIKVRDYSETPAGLLMLRTLVVRAQQDMADIQQDAMLEHATTLLEEFPDVLEDFNAAYASLNGMPADATNNAQFVRKYRAVRREMMQLVEQQVDGMRRISDLAFCFFLQKVCVADKDWELRDLYSLGKDKRKELSDFMSNTIGLQPDTTDEEDDDELTGESDKLVGENVTEGKT